LASSAVHKNVCLGTAALLTASAYGPMNGFAFIAPAGEGLGVFARQRLLAGQAIGEVGGPRLPVHPFLKQSDRAVVIPTSGANEPVFIDTNGVNSPFDVPQRFPASYVRCAHNPNARVEKWTASVSGTMEFAEQMWLVASETIPAGAEIRVDVKAFDGGRKRPRCRDDCWRLLRVPTPPPSGHEPVFDGLASMGSLANSPGAVEATSPDGYEEEQERGFNDDAQQYVTSGLLPPLPWEGVGCGNERLMALVPKLGRLGAHKFAIASTHIPGRSALECRDRWLQLQKMRQVGRLVKK